MRLNSSLQFWKCKDVAFVAEELEGGWLVTVITDVQKTICSGFKLNFSKMNRFGWKTHVVTQRLPETIKFKVISSQNRDAVLSAGICSWHSRRIRYNNSFWTSRTYFTFSFAQWKWFVLFVIRYLGNWENWFDKTMVSHTDSFCIWFSNCHWFEIQLFMINVHEWKLANSTQFQNLLMKLISVFELKNCSWYDNFCLFRGEREFDFLLLSLVQDDYKNNPSYFKIFVTYHWLCHIWNWHSQCPFWVQNW